MNNWNYRVQTHSPHTSVQYLYIYKSTYVYAYIHFCVCVCCVEFKIPIKMLFRTQYTTSYYINQTLLRYAYKIPISLYVFMYNTYTCMCGFDIVWYVRIRQVLMYERKLFFKKKKKVGVGKKKKSRNKTQTSFLIHIISLLKIISQKYQTRTNTHVFKVQYIYTQVI